jgi:hypothetical protein
MLARVDAEGMPAYLPSSNERNLALYPAMASRSPEVAIPGGPRIWPMWREPTLELLLTHRPASCLSPYRRGRAPAGRYLASKLVD